MVFNPTRGGGPTRHTASNFDKILKNNLLRALNIFTFFLTFIWPYFEKKSKFDPFASGGSFFKSTQIWVMHYFASKPHKNGSNFIKLGQRLYFDEFYGQKKSDFQKAQNCKFLCYIIFFVLYCSKYNRL